MSNIIVCPNCGNSFDIDQALSSEVEKKLRLEFNSKFSSEKSRLEEQLKREAQEKLRRDAEEYQNKLSKEIEAAQSRVATEMSDLKAANEEKDEKLKRAQQAELELRKTAREAEELKQTLQLELERRVEVERKQFQEEISRRVAEENRLRDSEKDRQLQTMKEQVEEMKRKMELSSQQAQGETLELELENTLKTIFPTDSIEEVAKGVRGADVAQKVVTPNGTFCGTILYETKRTKNFANEWILKLKEDMRQAKADVAVLVSTVLPKDVEHIGLVNGVWVSDLQSAMGLATALRYGLTEVARTKAANIGMEDKQAVLYQYLTGNEFRNRVSALVESFSMLRKSNDQERRAMERIWSEREQQLLRATNVVAGFFGDVQGITGVLEGVPLLELTAGAK